MDETLVIGRLIERLVITLAGAVSLVLGWNLFRVGVVSEQVAELSKADLLVRLQKVGPGVFFALFGTVILVVGYIRPLAISPVGAISYLNTSAGAAKQSVHSLNTTLDIVPVAADGQEIGPADLADLVAARSDLELIRNDIVRRSIGQVAFEAWVKHGSAYTLDPSTVPADLRADLEHAAQWMGERTRAKAPK